jgi:hypothetical protein
VSLLETSRDSAGKRTRNDKSRKKERQREEHWIVMQDGRLVSDKVISDQLADTDADT